MSNNIKEVVSKKEIFPVGINPETVRKAGRPKGSKNKRSHMNPLFNQNVVDPLNLFNPVKIQFADSVREARIEATRMALDIAYHINYFKPLSEYADPKNKGANFMSDIRYILSLSDDILEHIARKDDLLDHIVRNK